MIDKLPSPGAARYKKKKGMTEGELSAAVQAKIQNSIGYQGGRLSTIRQEAERYYNGDKFGNEVSGRSQVVSRDVAEAVDSIMPALMKIFTSGDEVVRFEPGDKSAADGASVASTVQMIKRSEEQAKQATEYVNWIFTTQNQGFHVLYTWFKSALIMKNGMVKIWWDEAETTTKETYKGLTEEEFTALLASEDTELVDDRAYPDPSFNPMAAAVIPPPSAPAAGMSAATAPSPPLQPSQGAPGAPGLSAQAAILGARGLPPAPPPIPMLHDCTMRLTNRDGRVKVAPIPEEEFLIDRRAVSLDEAPFTAHKFKTTITDLKEMFPEKAKMIDNLPSGGEGEYSMERIERFKQEDELPMRQDNPADPSMREIWVTEAYIKVDFDGDGYAELRKVTCAGDSGYTTIDNVEVDDHPFAALTPIPMPHKFFGMSITDQTRDIQLIKSTLIRGILDTMYNGISPQVGVVEGQVNLDDLLNRRPGGIVRLRSPTALVEIPNPGVGSEPYQMVEYFDTVREQRTGVTRYNQGLDADSLNKTAKGIGMIQNAGAERVELIARVFAETGVKRCFKRILELVCKHQQRARIIRLRGKWVEMDPREWTDQMDMTINVGLGTGSRDQQFQLMSFLLNLDQKIIELQGGIQGPLVTAENVYNKLAKVIEFGGLRSAAPYYTDPASSSAQIGQGQGQQRQDPHLQAAQIKAQADQAALQYKTQFDQVTAQQKAQQDAAELALRERLGMADLAVRRELGYADLKLKHEQLGLEARSVDIDATLKAKQHDTDTALRVAEHNAKNNPLNGNIPKPAKRKVTIHRDPNNNIAGATVEDLSDAPIGPQLPPGAGQQLPQV